MLQQVAARHDLEDIQERVAYYYKLSDPFDASGAPVVLDIDGSRKRYNLDLIEHAKGFGAERHLDFLFGDITYVPPVPKTVKSRLISDTNANSVVLNPDKNRHFTWTSDPLPFRERKPAAVWRDNARTDARRLLLEKFCDHPVHDIGHTMGEFNQLPTKNGLNHGEQKQFKHFISLEGNDVATNLKLGMASNMLVMPPRLHYWTWFMKGRLQPNTHFVLLSDDFSDLEDKVVYYEDHPDEAENLVAQAHAWVTQFSDPLKEKMIDALVLEKYFKLSGQV